MKEDRKRLDWSLAIPLLLLGLLLLCPIRDAMTMGGDEGFELSKCLFLERNPTLATRMWNDQPWLYTMVGARLFSLFGETPAALRALTMAAVVAMLFAIRSMFRRHATQCQIVLIQAFFITAELIIPLSLSAMLELPAIALAVSASAILYTGGSLLTWRRCLLSGVVYGCGLQVKLTAIVVAPGIVAMIVAQTKPNGLPRSLSLWTLSAVATVAIVLTASPTSTVRELLISHWYASRGLSSAERSELAFRITLLLVNPALCTAAIVGLVRAYKAPVSVPTLFATILLISAFGVAAVQRPWWRYYLIHFFVPLSIFGGLGAGWALAQVLTFLRSHSPLRWGADARTAEVALGPSTIRSGVVLLAFLIVAAWIGFTLPRVLADLQFVLSPARASDDAICNAMRHWAARTRWCYTRETQYAFHAGMLIPPELVVVPRKRYLAGDIDQPRIVATLKLYKPEVLLLAKTIELANKVWQTWLSSDYVRVAQDVDRELWVSKTVAPNAIKAVDDRLVRMGL